MSNKITIEIETAEDYKNVAEGNLNMLKAKVLPFTLIAAAVGVVITGTVLVVKIFEAFKPVVGS